MNIKRKQSQAQYTMKMRLLITLLVIVNVEAKKKRISNLQIKDASKIDSRKVDIYPEHLRHPVPFGHVFRNGIGDPKSDLKEPIDFWEFSAHLSKDREDTNEKTRMYNQMIPKDQPMNFASQKDEYLYNAEQKRKNGVQLNSEFDKRNETKTWFDWSFIHERNSAKRNPKPYSKKVNHVVAPTETADIKQQYFAVNSFELNSNRRESSGNWSTCDDYRRAINFHPKHIINIDWVPFYVWSTARKYFIATVHRFSYPTKKLVKEYKEKFGPYLNKSIDWDQPKLLLKEGLEFLLIAEDRIGMFNGIPNNEIPSFLKNKAIHIPTLSLRLKIVHPYLGIIHCDNQFATLMAVAGTEPSTDDEKISAAKRLKFRGKGFPVYRDFEVEKSRSHADVVLKSEMEKRKFLTFDEPIARSHFLDKE